MERIGCTGNRIKARDNQEGITTLRRITSYLCEKEERKERKTEAYLGEQEQTSDWEVQDTDGRQACKEQAHISCLYTRMDSAQLRRRCLKTKTRREQKRKTFKTTSNWKKRPGVSSGVYTPPAAEAKYADRWGSHKEDDFAPVHEVETTLSLSQVTLDKERDRISIRSASRTDRCIWTSKYIHGYVYTKRSSHRRPPEEL